MKIKFLITKFFPVKFSRMQKDELDLRYFVLPKMQVHMFPEAVDEDLYTDYNTETPVVQPKCQPNQILLRNLVSGELLAVNKNLVMRRLPANLPFKSVRNSCFYITSIIKLLKSTNQMKEIQIKDYKSVANDMFESDKSSKFGSIITKSMSNNYSDEEGKISSSTKSQDLNSQTTI